MMKRLSIVAGILIALVLIAGGGFYWLFHPKTLQDYLPRQVENLKLIRVTLGPEAIELAKASHIGRIESVSDLAIGYYEGDLSIWITKYPDAGKARSETKRMVEAMLRFGRGFEDLREIKMDGEKIYQTFPGGEAQYFWQKENLMIYIIPGRIGEKEAMELIRKINRKISIF